MIKRYTVLGYTLEVDTSNDAAIAEKIARQQARERALKIQDYRIECFSDKTLRQCTFENDDQSQAALTACAKDFVNEFLQSQGKCKGLLFYGKVGRGKTFISACIANALIDNCVSCYMTTFSRISNALQATWEKEYYIRQLMHYDLLIIDDLAAERNTEYMKEIVTTVIDERYRSGRPLIVTTNMTGQEMKNPADIGTDRILSRLFEMCDPVEVVGIDRRKEKLKKRIKQKGATK